MYLKTAASTVILQISINKTDILKEKNELDKEKEFIHTTQHVILEQIIIII